MTYDEFNNKWTEDAYKQATETDEKWDEYVKDCFDMYELYGFSKTFHSPYDSEEGHNGKPFKVLRRATYEECDIEAMPIWLVEFEGESEPYYCYPEEICLLETFCNDYNEVAKHSGETAEHIKTAFRENITNDDGEHIDLNYKSILVTFNVNDDGKVQISPILEGYNPEGIFLGTLNVAR